MTGIVEVGIATSTWGGYIDHRAIVGHAPESRDWRPGDPIFAPVIAQSARIEPYVTIDAGCERPTRIGERTWAMKQTHVGHDAEIGADCELSPGAVVCGYAELGDGVRVGVNASVLPYRKVGAGARIGAGAVVTHDVPAGETWAGNPARPLWPTHCGAGHKIKADEWARKTGLFACGCPNSSAVAAQANGFAAPLA